MPESKKEETYIFLSQSNFVPVLTIAHYNRDFVDLRLQSDYVPLRIPSGHFLHNVASMDANDMQYVDHIYVHVYIDKILN